MFYISLIINFISYIILSDVVNQITYIVTYIMNYLSHIIYHWSFIMQQVSLSYVNYNLSYITCRVSNIIYHISFITDHVYIYTSTAILQYDVYYIIYTLYIHGNPFCMNKSAGQPSATLGLVLQEVVTTWAPGHGRWGPVVWYGATCFRIVLLIIGDW